MEKARKKLEAAQAKAAQVEQESSVGSRRRGVKRKLDLELFAVSEQKAPPPSPEPAPKKQAQKARQSKTSPKPAVKLSPKARDFAVKHTPKKDVRQDRAIAALKLLRENSLKDLKLPSEDFSRKWLGCTQ